MPESDTDFVCMMLPQPLCISAELVILPRCLGLCQSRIFPDDVSSILEEWKSGQLTSVRQEVSASTLSSTVLSSNSANSCNILQCNLAITYGCIWKNNRTAFSDNGFLCGSEVTSSASK